MGGHAIKKVHIYIKITEFGGPKVPIHIALATNKYRVRCMQLNRSDRCF